MSVRTVITEGYGIFGTIPDIVTQGFIPGIGLEAEEGIALERPPPVDFVFNAGWEHTLIRARRSVLKFGEPRMEAPKREDSDLKEMIELYSRWKMAA